MRITPFFWASAFPLLASAETTAAEATDKASTVRQVAIIGAGAAGSSTAYHLRKFADEEGVPVNITVFEKTDHIGGRTLTVNAYGNPAEKVELGASIFIKLNEILYNATGNFNLSLQVPDLDNGGILGVWDGDEFVYQQDDASWGWWNMAKLFWKYGMAPYRTQTLMQATIKKFLSLYKAPYFPFRSLTLRAYELELTYITGQTGKQFLASNKISDLFSRDIIQASTRVNYASNLAKIHGLETMVAMAPEGATQVAGGNWQIFHNMAYESGAYVQLNTSVASISLADAGERKKFTLSTKSASSAESEEAEEEPVVFDNVVIAAPFQFSNIKASDGVLEHAIDEIPYVELHVTLFASPFQMAPSFFKLPAAAQVPTTVLTTLAEGEDPSSGPQGVGKAGFFSISTLRKVTNPKTGLEEYLYKVFSPEKLTAEFLTDMLGVDIPDTFTGQPPRGNPDMVEPISWYYPHVFHSYPRAYPRVTFQDPIVRDGLYYTSGIESFISTMETSALMGMNVARLIVDDFLGRETGKAVKEEDAAAAGEGPLDNDEL